MRKDLSVHEPNYASHHGLDIGLLSVLFCATMKGIVCTQFSGVSLWMEAGNRVQIGGLHQPPSHKVERLLRGELPHSFPAAAEGLLDALGRLRLCGPSPSATPREAKLGPFHMEAHSDSPCDGGLVARRLCIRSKALPRSPQCAPGPAFLKSAYGSSRKGKGTRPRRRVGTAVWS